MDFKIRVRHYATPLVIGSVLAAGMPLAKHDDYDQPHSHLDAFEPLNAFGHASIVIPSSSSVNPFYQST